MLDKNERYRILVEEIMSCSRCGDICEEGMINECPAQVPGQGFLDADIMFVAQNPGAEEVKNRQPLTSTGKSGKIFERLLSDLRLKREDVFTTNCVLCHSLKNREPEYFETKNCERLLKKQIDLVQPKIIVTFGRFAAGAFVNSVKISRDHGKMVRCEKFDAAVFPLYHPAYVGCYASLDKREEFKKDVRYLKKVISDLP